MFILNKGLSLNQPNDTEDTKNIKFSLTALGYHDDTDEGLSDTPTSKLFNSIKSFQKAHGLNIDGVIKPDGPTLDKTKEKLNEDKQATGAFQDFIKNWSDMREANTINADKYFHCKANYQASKRGWKGDETARTLGQARETYGQIVKNDGIKDMTQDLIANAHGRQAARSGQYESAEQACAIFRPDSLDEKY